MRLDTNFMQARTTAPQDNRQTPVSSNPVFIASGAPSNRLPSSHNAYNGARDATEQKQRTARGGIEMLVELMDNSRTLNPLTKVKKTNELIEDYGLTKEYLQSVSSSMDNLNYPSLPYEVQVKVDSLKLRTKEYMTAEDRFSKMILGGISDGEKKYSPLDIATTVTNLERAASRVLESHLSLNSSIGDSRKTLEYTNKFIGNNYQLNAKKP